MRFVLLLCSVLVFTPLVLVHAQVSSSIVGDAVSITLDPQFPNPGEPVTATLDDYAINSSGATISWYFEGHELPAMRNKRSVTLSSNQNGTPTKVEARLSFSNRPAMTAVASIKPIYLDIIIEPQTYVPVFYAGRALPVHGSVVNLIALIQTSSGMVDAAAYTYNWQLNGNSVYGGPQRGNNRAQITVPYGLASTLTLSVQDNNGTTIGRRVIMIPTLPVDLEFYQESILYGLSRKAVGESLQIIGNSSTIRAVPYYLDTRAIGGNIMSEWSIDGTKNTVGTEDPFEINLSPRGPGSSNIKFKFRNLSDLIQGGEKSFTATF